MMQEKKIPAQAQFDIKIGGSAPDGLMDDLAEVVVDTSLHLPSMFTIQLYDSQLKWINNDQLAVGQPVEISAMAPQQGGRSGDKDVLIKAEITAVEPEFGEDGVVSLLVRGYTRDHRLHRGKKVRTFLQMSDSDIVKKVAGEAGLQVKVDGTSERYEYLVQNNQTDFEFLLDRAQRIGYRLYMEDKTLFFKKPASQSESGLTLKWGDNLRHFRPRMTSSEQSSEVLVKGWDPKTKQEIVGRATVESTLTPKTGVQGTGSSISQSAFGKAQSVVVRRAVSSQQEADQMAQALADEISGNFLRAEGRSSGEPKLKAGYKVNLESVGQRFGGEYTVTSARHIYTPEVGYETDFSINGAKPETISSLLSSSNSDEASDDRQKIGGVVIGLVTNNSDPEELGRVKVKFPWLSDKEESNWARIATMMAGPQRGMLYIPEVNDEVLVAFEHGDMNYPYIVGSLWNGKDKPPLPSSQAVSGGKVNKRLIKTRSGHQIMLDDESGKENIHIIDKTGNNEILIDSVKNEISIIVDGNFIVKAKGKIIMESQGDMSLESSSGKVKGKAASGMTLETSASMTVKGSMVTVDSSGVLTLKGGVVKLN